MKWRIIRVFFYGFVLYAGMLIPMDFPFYIAASPEPIWGLKFTLIWGVLGGIAFIISWGCLYLLIKMYKAALVENENI